MHVLHKWEAFRAKMMLRSRVLGGKMFSLASFLTFWQPKPLDWIVQYMYCTCRYLFWIGSIKGYLLFQIKYLQNPAAVFQPTKNFAFCCIQYLYVLYLRRRPFTVIIRSGVQRQWGNNNIFRTYSPNPTRDQLSYLIRAYWSWQLT